MENPLLEIIVRKANDKDYLNKIPASIKEFMAFESPDKIVFDVSNNWVGFRDGTVINMLREFGKSLYAAVAYFSQDGNERITDFNGNALDEYSVIMEGKRCKKYVKKEIQVLKILDKEKDQFEVKRYRMELESSNPIILVLSMYSIGSEGGLKSERIL